MDFSAVINGDIPNGMVVTSFLAAAFGTWKVAQWTKYYFTTRSFNAIREQKKLDLYRINSDWNYLVSGQIAEEDAMSIVNLSFDELQKKLQNGSISVTKALRAYQYKAAAENKKSNFICEPIMEAQQMAVDLDALSMEERKKLPLFGIPISVKENYKMEGYDSTVGLVRLINKPLTETSPVIKMMVAQGAVPFIRTNLPQTAMTFESTNPIYGITSNPHDSRRSAGGSSGGEAAAIASCSSILGLGGDIGGSLRIPAAYCGIYSLKPTAGRWSIFGDVSVDFNERIVMATNGPMGRDVNSLISAMRTLSTPASYIIDPYVPPVTFNEQELKSSRPLRIGFFDSVGIIETSETCKRALDMTVTQLGKAGHEVVPWKPPNVLWALSVGFALDVIADGGETTVKLLDNDIVEDHMRDSIILSRAPIWLKKVLAYTVVRWFFPPAFANYLISSCGTGSVAKFWAHEAKIKEYRCQVVQELRRLEIDAIICPAMPAAAMRIGECKDAIGAMSYMGLFNVLNFVTGIVPITKVTEEDIKTDMESFPPKDMWHKAMKRNIVGSEGLPMCIQCASFPFHEERCLRLMKELEAAFGYKVLNEYTANA